MSQKAPAGIVLVFFLMMAAGSAATEKLYGLAYPNVYRYDGNGTTWTDLGKLGNNSGVGSLTVYDGKLYGGTSPSGNVYRYDGGTTWTDVGQLGTDRDVRSLVVYGGQLYGGTSAGRVYRYGGGTTWTKVGSPGTTTNSTWVNIMVVYNGVLYARAGVWNKVYRYDGGTSWTSIGQFGDQGGREHPLVIYGENLYSGSWNPTKIYRYAGGTAWTDLGALGNSSKGASSFAVHGGNLYSGTKDLGRVYRYDGGTTWTDVGRLGTATTVISLAAYGGNLYGTAGDGKFYKYDGGALWSYVSNSHGEFIYTLAPDELATPTSTPTSTPAPTWTLTVTPTTAETPNKPAPTGMACAQVITYAVNPEGKNCREFNTPCEVPRNWVVVESCLPVQQGKGCNNGCYYGDSCIPFGTVFVANGVVQYCDFAKKTTQPQKNDGAQCQNSYECTSNYCGDGICSDIQKELRETRGLLEKIIGFLKEAFGKLFPK